MGSLSFLPPSNLAVFGGSYFFVIVCKELNNAQTAQINQLFQLLNLICAYGDAFYIIFYGLTRMLTTKMSTLTSAKIRLRKYTKTYTSVEL